MCELMQEPKSSAVPAASVFMLFSLLRGCKPERQKQTKKKVRVLENGITRNAQTQVKR